MLTVIKAVGYMTWLNGYVRSLLIEKPYEDAYQIIHIDNFKITAQGLLGG
jgi:hypothetical protein